MLAWVEVKLKLKEQKNSCDLTRAIIIVNILLNVQCFDNNNDI